MAKRAISIQTVCQVVAQPQQLYILIEQDGKEYFFSVYKEGVPSNTFLFSSKKSYRKRATVVRKLPMILTLMVYRFKKYLISEKKKFEGEILTEEHIDRIKKALENGDNCVRTSVLLS